VRVGIVTTSFPTFDGDIAGSFVLGEAAALAGAGHSVDVIAPAPATIPTVALPAGVAAHWTRYAWPRRFETAFYGAGFRDNVRANAAAPLVAGLYPLATLRQHRALAQTWDQVVSHWAFPMAFAARALAPRAAHRAVFHGGDITLLERTPGARTMARAVASMADTLQFVSEDLRDRFLELLRPTSRVDARIRSFVAPMGVAFPETARSEARARLAFHGPTVLSMGRLVPVKGTAHLVDAAPLLARHGIGVVIAGDGPERESLERRAADLGAHVRFTGMLRGDDKWAALRGADVVVSLSGDLSASETEGTPVTAREAVAAGTPLVTTDAGGLRDVLRHGQGAVFIADTSPAEILRGVKLAMFSSATG
jgi:glycosyltransferase involved in cell wall biosynthesis